MSKAFATMLESSAAPYGYTLTIWSSGALLIHFRGGPQVWSVFLFPAGALAGFTLLGVLGTQVSRHARPLPAGLARVLAGMLDWVAVGPSVGAAALIAEIQSWVAWPLASLAATMIYLTAATMQLAATANADI